MAKQRKGIHPNALQNTAAAAFDLALAVEQRFPELCDLHLRITGEELAFPKEMERDVFNWRAMRVRHKGGDLRNSLDESNSTKRVAQWTLDIQSELLDKPRVVLD